MYWKGHQESLASVAISEKNAHHSLHFRDVLHYFREEKKSKPSLFKRQQQQERKVSPVMKVSQETWIPN